MTYLTEVNVTCLSGYETNDTVPSLLTCEAGGVWAGVVPHCDRMCHAYFASLLFENLKNILCLAALPCPILNVSHSNVTNVSSNFTQSVTIQCDEGYRIPNTSSSFADVTCLANQTFDLLYDSCMGKTNEHTCKLLVYILR